MSRVSIGLVFLLIVSNVLWAGLFAYQVIDSGITRTYMEIGCSDTAKSYDQLRHLSNPLFRGKSASEIRNLARGKIDDDNIFDKPSENLLVLGNVAFLLDSNERVERLFQYE